MFQSDWTLLMGVLTAHLTAANTQFAGCSRKYFDTYPTELNAMQVKERSSLRIEPR